MKTCMKKSVALLLAMVMAFCSITFGMTASAAEEKTVSIINLPRANDPNKEGWGHSNINLLNGWSFKETDHATVISVDGYEGKSCYCIEPGIALKGGDRLSGEGEDFWNNYPSQYNDVLTPDQIKTYIGRIMINGWCGNNSLNWVSTDPQRADEAAQYLATQLLIWEVCVGERDVDFNKVDAAAKGASNVLEAIQPNHPLYSLIMSHYTDIANKVKQHTTLPGGFSRMPEQAQTVELTWDGSQYSATIQDGNNILSNFEFTGTGLSFSKNGDQLTITSPTPLTDPVQVTANKQNSNRKGVLVWTDHVIDPNADGGQDIATYGETISDPIVGYLNVKTNYGSVEIIKTSEDDKIENIGFTIEGNGTNGTYYTDSEGKIMIPNLQPGEYTVSELPSENYEPQEPQQVTVIGGRTSTVTFNNSLKRGGLKVIKSSEDSFVEGIKFHLYGTSQSGDKVNAYAVTDESGIATFSDLFIGQSYTLEEVDTDQKYVIPEPQNATVKWNQITEYQFENVLKKFSVTLKKVDQDTLEPMRALEKGITQGDATLAGAIYGLYRGEELVDTYVTDSSGSFTTDWYSCGDNWTIREIQPPEGYLLNDEAYFIGAEAGNFQIEYNPLSMKAIEKVIKGNIQIIKHHDDGDTQIETPEQGAEFQLFLKQSGSYEQAKETERDLLITDENGFAESKDLPYGIYTVKQTKGAQGTELMPEFDVFIQEDGKVYRYLINNAVFKSDIEIVKKDSETGKIIATSGIGFKVRDLSTGEFITQHVNYPTPEEIDTFYTASNGKLMLPEPLVVGNYELVEQQAPYGYVLSETPVPFTVDRTETTITVEKYNTPQKGTIIIQKTGELFSSVTKTEDGRYQPVYQESNLSGVEFQITAAEDIVALDGTVRYPKGEVVDTITTDENGIASSKELYLGSYQMEETNVPAGMVKPEPRTVELTYAGQEVEVTELEESIYNQRQKVSLRLNKAMEQDELFGVQGELQSVVFGIYATEEIQAEDGSVIPKDGLIELVSCDENGTAAFQSDLPVNHSYYVQEYETDPSYILDFTKYPVETTVTDQETELIEITVNNGEPIENEIIRGTVEGKKVDEDGNSIEGALFGLFHPEETEFTEETAIATATSDAFGLFRFSDIPYGEWIVRELQPAPSFVLNETSYPVTVSEDQQLVVIEVENRHIYGELEITKTDLVDGKPLPNAGFRIRNEAGEVVEEGYTDENGIARFQLQYGTYTYEEFDAPDGYQMDTTPHAFEITEDGQIVKAVMTNEKEPSPVIETPATGDIPLNGFWIGLCAVVLGGVIALIIIKVKNKN